MPPLHLLCAICGAALEKSSEISVDAVNKMLTEVGYRDHITAVLAHLLWLPVCFWTELKVLVLTFKAPYHFGSTYLKNCLIPYEPSQTLQWSLEALFQVFAPSEWVFSVMASEFWNTFLRGVCLSPAVAIFCQWVKNEVSLVLFGIPQWSLLPVHCFYVLYLTVSCLLTMFLTLFTTV